MKTKQKQMKQRVQHTAKKVLVPHKVNRYRPHLIRLPAIAAILVVAVLAQLVYSFATTGDMTILGRASTINTEELLADTNEERSRAGLNTLALNDSLSKAAFLRAQDMLEYDYWAHTSPTGVQPWKWFADVDYNYSYAGENLAKNYPNAQATVDAWMGSETHKANVLNTHYTEVGFAVVEGDLSGQNTTLVVALYGAPVTNTALATASSQAAQFNASQISAVAPRPFEYFANALGALSPVTLAVLGIFAIVAIVGVAAHHYRNKLPKPWRQSWKVHHGMYTFVGMVVLGALIIIATGGGQI